MKHVEEMSTTIKCPHCGNKFSPEVALEHDIRVELEREFAAKMELRSRELEQSVRKAEEDRYKSRLQVLEADRAKLRELEERAVAVEEKERSLAEREEKADLEMRRRLLEREKLLREEAERKALEKIQLDYREKELELAQEKERLKLTYRKHVNESVEKAREEERMKMAEIQKKLDDQAKLINEMKRRAEQGSMQAQGEVQELAIEEHLRQNFLRDGIEEVAKGRRGGDCIHVVHDAYGQVCGKILYESKRTKTFGGDWISKLKEDMRLTQADIGVIVTEVLPNHMTHFGLVDNVWVCTFAEFRPLAALFRESLCRVGEVRTAQVNKGDKMQMLYDYLTSIEFRQKIEGIVESFSQMQEDLTREKRNTTASWARREKQIAKMLESTSSLYGDVRGIAGNAVREIEELEFGSARMKVLGSDL